MNDPLRKYRKRFRAWKNSRRLQAESSRYEKIFSDRNLSIPDAETIRKILRNRFPEISPKLKGRLNILAVYHNYNWENASLKPALEKFGSVRVYDWWDEFDHSRHGWLKGPRSKMNEALLRTASSWSRERPFDLIFTYISGELVSTETVALMRQFGAPLVNLALNDKESFVGKIRGGSAMGNRDICGYFDLCWTSTEDALKKYCVEGALPVYLPEGANPEVHRPVDVEKAIDVSFVGQCYGNRPDVLERLRKRGFRVEAFGFGWPNGPVQLDQMVRIYSRSRINLGFGGVDGHQDTFCLKGRDFEIPMSGGLYLTEYNSELDRFYKSGEEILTYTGFEDLVEKIQFILSNPEKAEAIRMNGYRRAQREHSWEGRFKQILRLMNLIST